MKKKEIRERICNKIEEVVKQTIGTSTPSIFHEPKVPECLKKNK